MKAGTRMGVTRAWGHKMGTREMINTFIYISVYK